MGQGLFHGLNTKEHGNWVVSGLAISVCLLVFCTLCNLYVYNGFFLSSVDVGNWAEPRYNIVSCVYDYYHGSRCAILFCLKNPNKWYQSQVRELSQMIIQIWGFVVAYCLHQIGDMQEKVFLQQHCRWSDSRFDPVVLQQKSGSG